MPGPLDQTNWNPAIINFIVHTCALPAVTCQNSLCEKGLFKVSLDAVALIFLLNGADVPTSAPIKS